MMHLINWNQIRRFLAISAGSVCLLPCLACNEEESDDSCIACDEEGLGDSYRWGSDMPGSASAEPTQEVLYSPGDDHALTRISVQNGRLYWFDYKFSDESWHLMGSSLDNTDDAAALLEVELEDDEYLDSYVADTERAYLFTDEHLYIAQLPEGSPQILFDDEIGPDAYGLDLDLVQDEQYVYVPVWGSHLFESPDNLILQIDKVSLQSRVLASGFSTPAFMTRAGDYLYFANFVYDASGEEVVSKDQIFRVHVESGELTALTNDDQSVLSELAIVGDSLFFLTSDDDAVFGDDKIVELNLEDRSLSVLVDLEEFAYDFRTDGERLFFYSFSGRIKSISPDSLERVSYPAFDRASSYVLSDGYIYAIDDHEIVRAPIE